ncbi:MAG: glycosyltransferase family 39 protein [Candidatus Omnitrophica bacterium]|nr:glycosyltransferase family 39 protein [Candidatus Omnitrophota bacterium]
MGWARRWLEAALWISIIGLAAGLRFNGLTRHDLTVDELFSLECSTGRGLAHGRLPSSAVIDPAPELMSLAGAPPWPAVWRATASEITHPPLYFLLLRGWRSLWGEGALAARSFSLIASLAAVLLAMGLARLQFGRGAGVLAGLLMAVAPPQITYAQEVRNYALVMALALGAALALVRIERDGITRARLMALGLCVFAGLLTHYSMLLTAAALLAYVVLGIRNERRGPLLLSVGLAVVAFLLVWGPWVGLQQPLAQEQWLRWDAPAQRAVTWTYAFSLPVRWFVELPDPVNPPIFLGGMSLSHAAMLGVACWGLILLGSWRYRRAVLLWSCWLLLPVVVLTAWDLSRSTLLLRWIRYTLLASLGVYVLVAGVVCRWRPWLRRMVSGILLAAAIGLAVGELQPSRAVQRSEWRRVVTETLGALQPGDVIAFDSVAGQGVDWYLKSLYLPFAQYGGRTNYPVLFLGEVLPAETIVRLRRAPSIWLVTVKRYPDAVKWLKEIRVQEERAYLDVMVYRLAWPTG